MHPIIWGGLPVEPPSAAEIAALRKELNVTQAKAAKLVGINERTWQYYEYNGDNDKRKKSPSPTTWGLFLLATGQHPIFEVIAK